MSDNLEILKAIRAKEMEMDERIAKAREEANRIIQEATANAEKTLREVEINGQKMYDEYLRKEMERINAETEALKLQFKEEVSKLKRDISQSALEKMMDILME
ncbi:MAG: hypothetical protein M1526_03540 [Candidatus Thermoplasmatota archaeon]|jgi:vacuolar-type H+-ATPase subunit H|nr:hypothetical protein [Candidatus Thermoplasmatota archaeon]